MKNRTKISKKLPNFYRVALVILAAAGVIMLFFLKKETWQKYASVRLEMDYNSVKTQETFPLTLTIDSSYEIEKVDLLITYDTKLVDLEKVSNFSGTTRKPNIQKKSGSLRLRAQNLGKKTELSMLFITKKTTGKADIKIEKEKSSVIAGGRDFTPEKLPAVSVTIEK